jgi:hypothetical protein
MRMVRLSCKGTVWPGQGVGGDERFRVLYEQTVDRTVWLGQGGGCGECVRVHQYTVSRRGQDREEDAASV